MLGVGFLFLMLEVMVLDATNIIRAPRAVRSSPDVVLLPLLLPLTAGTLMIAIGRLLMLRVPAETGAAAVLTAAAGLSWLRCVLLALATLFAFLAAIEDAKPAAEPHYEWVLRLYVLALLVGWPR